MPETNALLHYLIHTINFRNTAKGLKENKKVAYEDESQWGRCWERFSHCTESFLTSLACRGKFDRCYSPNQRAFMMLLVGHYSSQPLSSTSHHDHWSQCHQKCLTLILYRPLLAILGLHLSLYLLRSDGLCFAPIPHSKARRQWKLLQIYWKGKYTRNLVSTWIFN